MRGRTQTSGEGVGVVGGECVSVCVWVLGRVRVCVCVYVCVCVRV